MMRASIDLGTNTCLLLVAECHPQTQNILEVVEDHVTVVRLGQGVDLNRSLHPEAMARTLTCLNRYAGILRKVGIAPESALCVATSQARDAQNGSQFFDQVRRETGFHFQILSGDQEAEFTFHGALLPDLSPEKTAVIDIGGGSTELMATQGGQSIDMGCVRFTERYLKSNPVTDQEFWECQAKVDSLLAPLLGWRKSLHKDVQLLAVAGTATTLASWFLGLKEFTPHPINEVLLTRGDVHRMVEELKWRTIAERQSLTGIEAGRADILLGGAIILWRVMEVLDFSSTRTSTRGLRFGTLMRLKPVSPA